MERADWLSLVSLTFHLGLGVPTARLESEIRGQWECGRTVGKCWRYHHKHPHTNPKAARHCRVRVLPYLTSIHKNSDVRKSEGCILTHTLECELQDGGDHIASLSPQGMALCVGGP